MLWNPGVFFDDARRERHRCDENQVIRSSNPLDVMDFDLPTSDVTAGHGRTIASGSALAPKGHTTMAAYTLTVETTGV